jgi:hypothetical protein
MGSGSKTWSATNVLTAADVNNYLGRQVVMSFASIAARDAAMPTPDAGMCCYVASKDASEGLYFGNTNGAAAAVWRKGPSWNAPWGTSIAATSTVAHGGSVSCTAVTDVTSLVLTTNTLPAGRRLQWTVEGFLNSPSSVLDIPRVSIWSGTSGGAVLVNRDYPQPTTLYAAAFMFSWEETSTAAAISRRVRIERTAGSTGNVTFFSDGATSRVGRFSVADLGPAAAPS